MSVQTSRRATSSTSIPGAQRYSTCRTTHDRRQRRFPLIEFDWISDQLDTRQKKETAGALAAPARPVSACRHPFALALKITVHAAFQWHDGEFTRQGSTVEFVTDDR